MLFWPALSLLSLLGGTALWVQLPQMRAVALAGLVLAIAATAGARLATPWGWAALLALAGVLGVWYGSLAPRDDRDWAPDVARIVSGTVAGEQVTLHGIRRFRWQDRDHGAPQWASQSFDLDRLATADLFTSVWANPHIAHLLVSFGFSDGAHVVFSVEIRREKGEAFTTIGGFFRQFELALIAADEEDIVKLRTNFRQEEVRRFPLQLTPDQLRALFLGYVDLGNRLNAAPRWYNTVTDNCTTVIWQLAKVLKPDLGLNTTLLLSADVPGWLQTLGVLPAGIPVADLQEQARISARARTIPPGADFSQWIRQP